jgi:osmotically inducible protein OsmC
MSILSKAAAQWSGPFKSGRGTMKPAHGTEEPFSVTSRFEEGRGTNPEEMIGAALAGCFSMALSLALGQAGHDPDSIDTSATVSLDKDGAGYKIASISLTTQAKVPGLDAAAFATIAEQTKQGCPVSKALAGTTITLYASLD